MIESTTGNLLDAEVDALVNTVNCVGVMGKGIALQFKQRFPDMFECYKIASKHGKIIPGKMSIFITNDETGKYIINFPTKRHWRDKSLIEDIDSGLIDLIEIIKNNQIKSIAIPPLGCGLGGLDWSVVRSKIVLAFEELPSVRVFLFERM